MKSLRGKQGGADGVEETRPSHLSGVDEGVTVEADFLVLET